MVPERGGSPGDNAQRKGDEMIRVGLIAIFRWLARVQHFRSRCKVSPRAVHYLCADSEPAFNLGEVVNVTAWETHFLRCTKERAATLRCSAINFNHKAHTYVLGRCTSHAYTFSFIMQFEYFSVFYGRARSLFLSINICTQVRRRTFPC